MQSPPAVEGMLLHGILHRVEGDFENARAWVGDVWSSADGKAVMRGVYCDGAEGNGLEVARRLIGDVEALRGDVKSSGQEGREEQTQDLRRLGEGMEREMGRLVSWCAEKFGAGRWEDASSAYAGPSEKIRKIGEEMVSGSKGYREF